MLAFRVADRRHPLFDGTGAALKGARWNSPGRRIIYASDSLAGAMLEVLAYLPVGFLPKNHAYIRIEIPDLVTREIADPEQIPDWASPESPAARDYGDRWYDEQRSCVLLVPSIIVPEGHNVLINPNHPDFNQIHASNPQGLKWDDRLFCKG